MAPPSVTGNNDLLVLTNVTGGDVVTAGGVTSATTAYNATSERLRLTLSSNTAALHAAEINLPSSVDLTANGGVVIVLLVEQNFGIARNWAFRLRSGATTGTNYRGWKFPGGLRLDRCLLFIDPSRPGTADNGADDGGFDPSDVRAVGCSWDGTQNARWDIFNNIYFVYKNTGGLTVAGGEIGDPVKLEPLIEFLIGDRTNGTGPYWLSSVEQTSFVQSIDDEYASFPLPISLGDGATTDVVEIRSALATTPESTSADPATNATRPTLEIGPFPSVVNTQAPQTLQGYVLKGSTVGNRFEERSTVTNTFVTFFLADMAGADLGSSNFEGSLVGLTDVATGGASLVLNFIDFSSTVVYQWNGTATLGASTFNSPLAEHYVDIPSTTPNGSTLDVSAVTFTTNPTTNLFRTNVPAGEVIIIIVPAGSGLSLADVTELGPGTTIVNSPPVSISITAIDSASNPISGASVFLRLLDTTEVVNGETNAAGTITAQYFGVVPAAIDTTVSAVRSSSGPTPYQQFTLGGNITADGYVQTTILQEDT